MATETLAPPSAPAPSPNATPAAAPKASAAPTPAPSTSNEFDDIDARLNPPAPETKTAVKKETKPTEDDKALDEVADETPAVEDKKPAAAADKESKTFQGPKWAREQIEKANARAKELESKLAEREAKLTEFTKKGEESGVLSDRLTALEKERDEALATARALKQEVSPEFKAKHDVPFERAAARAKDFFEQLTITEADGVTTRRASWEQDFAALYNQPEVAAHRMARELFKDDAALVMQRYNQLHDMSRDRADALEVEKKNWKQTETAREAAAIQQREQSVAAIAAAKKEAQAKFPEFFGEDPKDVEGMKLVSEMAAKMAAPARSLSEHAARMARVELSVVNFPRVVRQLNLLKAELAAEKARNADIAAAEPGSTRRKSGDGEKATDNGTWDSDLAKLRAAR